MHWCRARVWADSLAMRTELAIGDDRARALRAAKVGKKGNLTW